MTPLAQQLQYNISLQFVCETYGMESKEAEEMRALWQSERWNKLTPQQRQLCVSVVSALEDAEKAGS